MEWCIEITKCEMCCGPIEILRDQYFKKNCFLDRCLYAVHIHQCIVNGETHNQTAISNASFGGLFRCCTKSKARTNDYHHIATAILSWK